MTIRTLVLAFALAVAIASPGRAAGAQETRAHDTGAHDTGVHDTGVQAADAPGTLGVPAPRALDPRLVARFTPHDGVPAAQSRQLPPTFSRRDLAYWGAALATGAVAFALDERIVDAMPHPDSIIKDDGGLDYAAMRFSTFNEYYAFYGAVAMYGYGRIFGKSNLAEAAAHATEAALLSKIAMDVGRGLSGRARPRRQIHDGDEVDAGDFEFWRGFREEGYGAFPSRHVTGISAVTSALAFETAHHWPQHSRWVTPLAIATPLAAGLGRMYTSHHWSSDVVIGAAIGTWLGWKTVRYTHNHPNNWVDRVLLGR